MIKARNPQNLVSGTLATDLTDTTLTTVVAAPGAGLRTYITHITVTNSHATTGTVVKIINNSVTIYRNFAKAGGGFSYPLVEPLRGAVNTTWQIQCETTGAAVQCSMSGFKHTI